MTGDLFAALARSEQRAETLCPGATLLAAFALSEAPSLLESISKIAAQAPFRHLITPGGFRMSVGMTNCGALGWVSDRHGYRYTAIDPATGRPWPTMPAHLTQLAHAAALRAGFSNFAPDVCLINRYRPGARLTLHQDKNERDFGQPIVSVSLGLPATFLLGGLRRSDKVSRLPLWHGDVVVWGGPARLRYHGVLTVPDGHHSLLGAQRLNLTFRRAG